MEVIHENWTNLINRQEKKSGSKAAVLILPEDILFCEDLWVLDIYNVGKDWMTPDDRERYRSGIIAEYNRVDRNPFTKIVWEEESDALYLERMQGGGRNEYDTVRTFLYHRLERDLGRQILDDMLARYREQVELVTPSIWNVNGRYTIQDYNTFYLVDNTRYSMGNLLMRGIGASYSRIVRRDQLLDWVKQHIDVVYQKDLHLSILSRKFTIQQQFGEWLLQHGLTEEIGELIFLDLLIILQTLENLNLAKQKKESGVLDIPLGILPAWDYGLLQVFQNS